MKFKLSVKLLSTNKLWKGRKFKTKEYDSYINLMLYSLPKMKKINGLYSIDVVVYIKRGWLKPDVSNFIKGLEDCIVKKGLVEDDRFCVDLRIRKKQSSEDRVEIEIKSA